MYPQLSFKFTEARSYSSEAFIVHTGIKHISDSLVMLSSERRYGVIYVYGERLAGKTHLGVYCAGIAQSLGSKAWMVSAEDVVSWHIAGCYMGEATPGQLNSPGSVIIDDADKWLSGSEADGTFTAIADSVLQTKGILVLLGSVRLDALSVSPHIHSRLVSGIEFGIELPLESELDQILLAMSKQRGLRLTKPKRDFILKRIPRTVPALTLYLNRLQTIGEGVTASTSFELLAAAAEEVVFS